MVGKGEHDVEFYFMKTCAAINSQNQNNEFEALR